MVWGRGPTSFLSMWISSCPSKIFWKDYSFPMSQGPWEDLMKIQEGKMLHRWRFPHNNLSMKFHLVLGPPCLPQFLWREHSWLEKWAQNSMGSSLMPHRIRMMSPKAGTGISAESNNLTLLRKHPRLRERWLAQGHSQLAVAGPRATSAPSRCDL